MFLTNTCYSKEILKHIFLGAGNSSSILFELMFNAVLYFEYFSY